MQTEHDQREASETEAHQQNFPGADMIGEIADRGLGQAGTHGKNGQRKAEFDVSDIELLFQKRKQHRQHEDMEMAHPVSNGYRAQRAELFIFTGPLGRRGLLRRGQNIGHSGASSLLGSENIGPAGYLSINMAAWQPAATGLMKPYDRA